MILMEGLMLVPPERGTIIGRAVWKPRYVVLGSGAHLHTQTEILEKSNSKKGKSIKSTSSKPSLADLGTASDDGLFISVYKAKGDWEYIAQHPISAFKSCEIRSLSHRKQATPLPTLMLELKPDSISEKQRKRRSSRTGGLTSNKDAQWADTLLFRSVPEDRNNIYDWQITIKPRLQIDDYEESPMSPLSPIFTSFTNPFSARDPRPSSRNGKQDQQTRPPFQSSGQYTQPSRDRPSAMISPSPSLRSRRSDLSSQASSSHPPMGFTSAHPQYNNTILPADLPSPISVSGYDNFIEGWTSAQGRSSALSHHTRGSNSIASAIGPPLASPTTTSPGPRETILDRAFQMRCIPGSERLRDEEEKGSSIARFEALMREHDERALQRAATSATDSKGRFKPGWELEEESEESDNEDPGNVLEQLDGHDILMPTPAQRALDYIAGRQTPLPRASSSSSRPISPNSPPVPFLNRDAMNALHSGSSSTNQSFSSGGNGLRPRTGTTSSHMRKNSRPTSLALPPRSISSTVVPSLKDSGNGNSGITLTKAEMEKRRSSTSTKRLSFQEFARRLSSTSSLLLVQTNASSNSGRGDSFRERDDSRRDSVSDYGLESAPELAEDNEIEGRRGFRGNNGLSLRGGDVQVADREMKRCGGGFRGMGVLGGEGGFL
ncbi:hypothetical protein BOTNAR_0210g00020 [Botryotinia narcissicola]|uniref:Uncharacterized protein n=1 Tax=Botryotinia narcissicola TaxID=278944 RepID=A0A4Z1I8H8_9HELO|nr:hypothetical protein BOTNAR_0210g00020 [Botryotinia narcissicola]